MKGAEMNNEPRTCIVKRNPNFNTLIKHAREINFKPTFLLREEMLNYLFEKGIEIYKNHEVAEFLASAAEENECAWVWRPLRPQDKPNWEWHSEVRPTSVFRNPFGHGSYRRSSRECSPYQDSVPEQVLELVKEVESIIKGGRIKFLVSHYPTREKQAKVYIMAAFGEETEHLIFSAWDNTPGR